MFRTLKYPSSGACDYSVELPHWSYCSWFDVCWGFDVVSVLQGNTDTTPTQPHRNSNTHRTNLHTVTFWETVNFLFISYVPRNCKSRYAEVSCDLAQGAGHTLKHDTNLSSVPLNTGCNNTTALGFEGIITLVGVRWWFWPGGSRGLSQTPEINTYTQGGAEPTDTFQIWILRRRDSLLWLAGRVTV